jgi:hypothetical protein
MRRFFAMGCNPTGSWVGWREESARGAFPINPEPRLTSALLGKLIAERAGAATEVPRKILERRCDIYRRGGLNE